MGFAIFQKSEKIYDPIPRKSCYREIYRWMDQWIDGWMDWWVGAQFIGPSGRAFG